MKGNVHKKENNITTPFLTQYLVWGLMWGQFSSTGEKIYLFIFTVYKKYTK